MGSGNVTLVPFSPSVDVLFLSKISLPSSSVPTTESGFKVTVLPITLLVGIPSWVVLIWILTGELLGSTFAKYISTAVKYAPSISSFVSITDGASILPPTANVWASGSSKSAVSITFSTLFTLNPTFVVRSMSVTKSVDVTSFCHLSIDPFEI